MITVEEIAAKIGARPCGSGKWKARCPAHDDRAPSFSLTTGDDGRVLVHCFAGCTLDQIAAAMEIDVRELFPARPRRGRRRHWQRVGGRLDPDSLTTPEREKYEQLSRIAVEIRLADEVIEPFDRFLRLAQFPLERHMSNEQLAELDRWVAELHEERRRDGC